MNKVAAEFEPVEKHVVIVFVPGLSFNELEWLYNHAREEAGLWKTGALSAVNVKPDGPYSYLNNAVSLGVGKKALGIKGWNAYSSGETIDGTTVDNLYLQWHGKLPSATVIHPSIHLLQDKNSQSSFHAKVGWLGESFKEQGVHTYVLGHSDLRDEKVRYGSLLIMDEEGFASGDLAVGVVDNESMPVGKKMDADRILQEVINNQQMHDKSFTIVEWGDLYRLYSELPNMAQEHFARMYKETLLSLEDTVQQLLDTTEAEVWLLSPGVNDVVYKQKNQLAPLWIWTEDREESGFLYSDTTRRSYVISNTDLAATWPTLFGGPTRNEGIGQPISYQLSEQGDSIFPVIKKRIDEMNSVFADRGAVLSSYVSSLVVMLVIVSLLIWLLDEANRWKRVAQLLLLSGILSPFWFLITSPWIMSFTAYVYVLVIMAGSFVTAFVLNRVSRDPYSVACLLFFAALLLDVSLGSYLTQRSFLSYDPVIGARYYGIGNEFAGILIVAGLLMMAPLLKWVQGQGRGQERFLQWGVMSVLVVGLVFLLGMSVLGANAGASLSVGVVYVYVTSQLLFRSVSVWKKAVVGLGVFFVLFFALFLLQMSQPSSHIYIAFKQLFSGDWTTIFQIIARKLQMNWKIFKISYWTQLFITSYFLIGVLLWKRRRTRLDEVENFLMNGCIVASLALLVLNDSGIVAAATSMFITLSVCYGWTLQKEWQG